MQDIFMISGAENNLLLIEREIQRAAIHGRYDAFKANFKVWQDEFQSKNISVTTIRKLFLSGPAGSVLQSIIAKIDRTKPNESCSLLRQYEKIIIFILDQFQEYGMNIDQLDLFITCKWPSNGELGNISVASILGEQSQASILTVANQFNLARVLIHPLVVDQLLIHECVKIYLNGYVLAARKYYNDKIKTRGISNYRIFNEHHITNPIFYGNNENTFSDLFKDQVLADLANHNELPISVLNAILTPIPPIHDRIKEMPADKWPLLQQTEFFQLLQSIAEININGDTSMPECIAFLNDYIEEKTNEKSKNFVCREIFKLLSGLARHLQSQMPPLSEPVPEILYEKLDICFNAIDIVLSNLQNNWLHPKLTGSYSRHPLIDFVNSSNALRLLKHKIVKDSYKSEMNTRKGAVSVLSDILEKSNCSQGFKYLDLFREVCKLIPMLANGKSIDSDISFDVARDILPIINNIPARNLPKDNPARLNYQAKLRMIGLLLKHDLIRPLNFESIITGISKEPGESSETYTFQEYIASEPILLAGYLKPVRDRELKHMFALIKAIKKDDLRTGAMQRRVDIKVQSGLHSHSLLFIRNFMRENPDVAQRILGHLDPNRYKSVDEKALKSNSLWRIA